MQIKLHANARTTPKIRQYIQSSTESVANLAKELGINESTVRKWKARTSFSDRSHTRHNLLQSTSLEEEEIIVELRQMLGLSLNDITEVIQRCVNPNLSRSSIYRCLKEGAQRSDNKSQAKMRPFVISFKKLSSVMFMLI